MIRINFIKTLALTGSAISVAPGYALYTADPKKVGIGFLGEGSRGRSHLKNILMKGDVAVPSVCDIEPGRRV